MSGAVPLVRRRFQLSRPPLCTRGGGGGAAAAAAASQHGVCSAGGGLCAVLVGGERDGCLLSVLPSPLPSSPPLGVLSPQHSGEKQQQPSLHSNAPRSVEGCTTERGGAAAAAAEHAGDASFVVLPRAPLVADRAAAWWRAGGRERAGKGGGGLVLLPPLPPLLLRVALGHCWSLRHNLRVHVACSDCFLWHRWAVVVVGSHGEALCLAGMAHWVGGLVGPSAARRPRSPSPHDGGRSRSTTTIPLPPLLSTPLSPPPSHPRRLIRRVAAAAAMMMRFDGVAHSKAKTPVGLVTIVSPTRPTSRRLPLCAVVPFAGTHMCDDQTTTGGGLRRP